MKRDSLVNQETKHSKDARDLAGEEWDPDWMEYNFVAWGQCQEKSCKQDFAISGTGGMGPEQDENGYYDWGDYFSPMYCNPMPKICTLPKKCPKDVAEELQAAFELFWAHPASCAVRIRVALECIMNQIGVPKKAKGKDGKFHDLNLHQRIDKFTQGDPENGAHLMALKWLGNAGSHDSDVKKADLLDAFEIIEHTLSEIIDRRSARVTKLAKKITKKHAKKKK